MKRIFLMFVVATGWGTQLAQAAPAYTQGITHLRAGPSVEFPLVVSLPPNTLLDVNGCLDDYTWCDVSWAGNRGWVYGNYLLYDYQDRRVPILSVGAALGIGIVAFSLGDYWGRYYVGRPWYGRRDYWMHRPLPPRRPPPRPGFGPGPGHRPGVGPGPGRPAGGGHAPGRPPGGSTPGKPPGGARPPGGAAGGRPPGGGGARPGSDSRPAGGGGGRPGAGSRPGGSTGRPGGGGARPGDNGARPGGKSGAG